MGNFRFETEVNLQPTKEGFYLALVDIGSCATLRSVNVMYSSCAEVTD